MEHAESHVESRVGGPSPGWAQGLSDGEILLAHALYAFLFDGVPRANEADQSLRFELSKGIASRMVREAGTSASQDWPQSWQEEGDKGSFAAPLSSIRGQTQLRRELAEKIEKDFRALVPENAPASAAEDGVAGVSYSHLIAAMSVGLGFELFPEGGRPADQSLDDFGFIELPSGVARLQSSTSHVFGFSYGMLEASPRAGLSFRSLVGFEELAGKWRFRRIAVIDLDVLCDVHGLDREELDVAKVRTFLDLTSTGMHLSPMLAVMDSNSDDAKKEAAQKIFDWCLELAVLGAIAESSPVQARAGDGVWGTAVERTAPQWVKHRGKRRSSRSSGKKRAARRRTR